MALGPKPRAYRQKTPKKMVRLALRSALSDRAGADRVALVDQWPWTEPRTKDALGALEALGLDGRVLVVLGPDDVVAERSFGNLQRVQVAPAGELSAYDILRNDWLVFTDETLPGGEVDLEELVVEVVDAETGDTVVVDELVDVETGEELAELQEAEFKGTGPDDEGADEEAP